MDIKPAMKRKGFYVLGDMEIIIHCFYHLADPHEVSAPLPPPVQLCDSVASVSDSKFLRQLWLPDTQLFSKDLPINSPEKCVL